jgi:hypothetical protein
MKKILLVLFLCLSTVINAQLPDGSVAPDWTLTDINGTTHNLYNYLDSNYTVFIDFSAVWCSPCWSYHTSGALEDLYIHHGPIGYPNVDSNTTNDVMVFFIEGDANTVANLGGSGGGTQGDWITGTPYPIVCTDGTVNSTAVKNAYAVGYWPTIYKICPDRILVEAGQSSHPYNLVNSCPPPASNSNDAKVFTYSGQTETCDGGLTPEITFQNYGLTNLTSLDIKVYMGGALKSTTPWTGNLATYQVDNVILPTIYNVAFNFIEIRTTLPSGQLDDDATNNNAYFSSIFSQQNVNVDLTIEITTDQFGSETTWDIKTGSGLGVAGGGPYNDLSSIGTTTQTPVQVSLNSLECHTFTIYDAYGDGICCNYGSGSYTVTDGNGNPVAIGGGFNDEQSVMFRTGAATVGMEEISKTEYIDNRIFDLLGREYNNYNLIPKGIIYIQNREKFIKHKNKK